MLDRNVLLEQLSFMKDRLFADHEYDNACVRSVWARIVQDPDFTSRASQAPPRFQLPNAWEPVGAVHNILPQSGGYTVLSVDGSQIYPDRHMFGGSCFLINVGGIVLTYGPGGGVSFFSQPRVFVPQDVAAKVGEPNFSQDLVDLVREEFELKKCALQSEQLLARHKNVIALFDGSLVFFHLEQKSPQVRAYFMQEYLAQLEYLYHLRIPIAGYISLPRGGDLANYISFELSTFTECDYAGMPECHGIGQPDVDGVLDAHIASWMLGPMQRTGVFASTASVASSYPEHLRPYFCYVHVGQEIGRIEVPAWVAQDRELIDKVCSVVVDQCDKGRGYPVAIAEAHEQAVVKGADRDFFYHLIHKMGIAEQKKFRISQKSLKKRGIGI
jgi:hypothetical protein